ncbi:hypothetical protein GCM10020221_01020 [Streptomyces thioluteus]|uniref:Methyltransferase domain-containing protein n=1 Tax=Streptomyces thioluteus TaxID=66431 RepID=A0ABN3WB56_STRTU
MPHAATTWDPAQYLRHEGHRTRPFLDLLARIPDLPAAGPARIVDLGCGAATSRPFLAERWPDALITGLDNSPEMLRDAQAHAGRTAAAAGSPSRGRTPRTGPDRAARPDRLQRGAAVGAGSCGRVPRVGRGALPGRGARLSSPGNHDSPSHTLLHDLCESPRWRDRLDGSCAARIAFWTRRSIWRRLASLGLAVDAWETTYCICWR